MSNEAMFSGFDESSVEEQIARYRDEAIERYGSEVVERSERQVRSLSPEDWERIGEESGEINQSMASLMDTHPAESPETQAVIERWYNLLNRYFASYSPDAFAGLGELYVADERFARHYDEVRPGLAVYFRDAMTRFAERHRA